MTNKLLLPILIMISLCMTGCGSDKQPYSIVTKTHGAIQTEYVYSNGNILSKSMYNTTTKITTECTYQYYYNDNGCVMESIDIMIFNDKGEIVSEHTSKINYDTIEEQQIPNKYDIQQP